jgi:acyl-[acyl carrier protein]--UDP-N-acetylglucosamine O-acyltransferase
MERHGFSPDTIEEVRMIFKTLYKSNLNRSQAIEKLKGVNEIKENSLILEFTDFISTSDRGIA